MKRQHQRLQERQREVISLQTARDDILARLEAFKREAEKVLHSKLSSQEIEQTKTDVSLDSNMNSDEMKDQIRDKVAELESVLKQISSSKKEDKFTKLIASILQP